MPADTVRFQALLARWDAQQASYIADREGRFRALLDALELTFARRGVTDPLIVDLACGPGSLSARVLDRFPTASVIALDLDPVLLALARGAHAEHPATRAGRLRFVDADLADEAWTTHLDDRRPDAAVSSTALHWLAPDRLAALYRRVHEILTEDGLLLNADHQRFGAGSPRLRGLAEAHDATTHERAVAAGAEDWDTWWTAATAEPGLAEHAAERAGRFASRPEPAPTPVAWHLDALAAAGFAEVGTVWQLFDDYVLCASR